MKELLQNLVHYNMWANAYFAKQVLQLSDEVLDKEMQGSFTSIRKTVYHIWMAEDIWMQRLQLVEAPTSEALIYNGECKLAIQKWLHQSEALQNFVAKQKTDEAFSHEMIYIDLNKNSHKNKVAHIIQHVCNHSSFHRGQLVCYLRAVGVTKIESTDYIHWCRKEMKK
jgi:uncharacterized damage-inducible protein DinB